VLVGVPVLFGVLMIINWFIYPFTSAKPNFKDVETVFNRIQVPSDWQVIDESENSGIAGRQCPIESATMCFHKSKTYTFRDAPTVDKVMQLLMTSGCSSVETTTSERQDLATINFECISGIVKVRSTLRAASETIYISSASR